MVELVHDMCGRTKTTTGWLAEFIDSFDPFLIDDAFIFCDSCKRLDSLTRFARQPRHPLLSAASQPNVQSDDCDVTDVY